MDHTVIPGASASRSRQRKNTPPSSPLSPRWVSYHADSRFGSSALKNTPPNPVILPMQPPIFDPHSTPASPKGVVVLAALGHAERIPSTLWISFLTTSLPRGRGA